MSEKLIFSGHDTFHCKEFWLKKGYDFVINKNIFNDEASIELGVGRNMVNSIRFWIKAFNIVDAKTEKTTEIGDFIFCENSGVDKYLENETTLWLLHYLLIKNDYSSIYSTIFNSFRKSKPEFNKDNFISYMKINGDNTNPNTLAKDFSVFTRMYHSKDEKTKESSFSGLFSDLELVQLLDISKKYFIKNDKQKSIAIELLLYIILDDKEYGKSISFKHLFSGFNSIGNIFSFSKEELENKLIELSDKYDYITYSNDAGIKELQFKKKPNSLKILKSYYGKS